MTHINTLNTIIDNKKMMFLVVVIFCSGYYFYLRFMPKSTFSLTDPSIIPL